MARLAQFGCVLGGGGRCTALFLGATRGGSGGSFTAPGVGMNQVVGWRRCQRFSGVALFLSFGGGKPLKCRWPGEVTGEAGISAGMGAFGRDSHRRACCSATRRGRRRPGPIGA